MTPPSSGACIATCLARASIPVASSRSSAAALCDGGHVRLNGERVGANSQPVKNGDVVTVALDRAVRVLKVTSFAERRGDADAARLLFEDLTPISVKPDAADRAPQRDPGTGRPTKQERRAIDRLLDRDP